MLMPVSKKMKIKIETGKNIDESKSLFFIQFGF